MNSESASSKVPHCTATVTLNQSILWAGERKEERKEYSEGLRRFFVIVWPIKINGREEGRKSDWSNLF